MSKKKTNYTPIIIFGIVAVIWGGKMSKDLKALRYHQKVGCKKCIGKDLLQLYSDLKQADDLYHVIKYV